MFSHSTAHSFTSFTQYLNTRAVCAFASQSFCISHRCHHKNVIKPMKYLVCVLNMSMHPCHPTKNIYLFIMSNKKIVGQRFFWFVSLRRHPSSRSIYGRIQLKIGIGLGRSSPVTARSLIMPNFYFKHISFYRLVKSKGVFYHKKVTRIQSTLFCV